jgi:hypothetical protein
MTVPILNADAGRLTPPAMSKPTPDYVMYLDETGNHTFTNSYHIGKRYLGLAGPFLSNSQHALLELEFNNLKRTHGLRQTTPLGLPAS